MNDLIYADNKARMADYDRADRQEDELKKNHDFVQFTRKGMTKLSTIRNGLSHALFHLQPKRWVVIIRSL